ncbi:MAG: 4'-phosphopantetheinyl transferase [Planctomycetota bacterium JB042]
MTRASALFPSGVVVVEADPAFVEGRLFPEEESSVAAAVEKRRREFRAGRTLARDALALLGVAPVALPVGERREPVWPGGVVGSITHTRGYCAVVAARTGGAVAGIGIDVEPDEPLKEALLERIALPAERDRLARHGEPTRLGRVLFCAKEALYKAQFPGTRRFLAFEDVEVDLDLASGRFTARTRGAAADVDLSRLAGRVRVDDGYVLAGAVIGP